MIFCDSHWTQMRAAVADRGLSGLILPNGKAATRRIVDEIEGTATDSTWDPLMASWGGIVRQSMRAFGLPLFYNDDCPLCLVQQHHEECQEAGWSPVFRDTTA